MFSFRKGSNIKCQHVEASVATNAILTHVGNKSRNFEVLASDLSNLPVETLYEINKSHTVIAQPLTMTVNLTVSHFHI
jgi:hypothetical protein